MSQIKFTETHEWLRVEGDGTGTIGITDYAQNALGDLVFIGLPEVGAELAQGAEGATIESVKAAGEIHMPVGGTVIETNASLADDPAQANSDPLGAGWFLKIKLADPAQLDALMDQAAYDTFVAGLD
ncbi:MAG TPA: glycine cleavage system protein GcvH [Candidatus Competibacter sp.]|nr:glycine cleavage system protein GcvH [Candidatus Competibacteraceae bacterium]HRC72614.1 glycine cleavage system protein GcvH [Candidatus Competibacter sp.]